MQIDDGSNYGWRRTVGVDDPEDVFGARPGKTDWAQEINQWTRDSDGKPMYEGRTIESRVRQYHRGVVALDEGIGRIIAALEESGQRENTLIVFASDQGLTWGQHGFRSKKHAAYDSNIRGPLIFSMPGRIPENEVVEAPVAGLDIVPTIFQFAGIELPWRMHGDDLAPLLREADRLTEGSCSS